MNSNVTQDLFGISRFVKEDDQEISFQSQLKGISNNLHYKYGAKEFFNHQWQPIIDGSDRAFLYQLFQHTKSH